MPGNVRFGSKADMCSAKRHVRFTPIATSIALEPTRVMNSRRLMPAPEVEEMTLYSRKLAHRKGLGMTPADVRIGSKADMCAAIAMSVLPPKGRLMASTFVEIYASFIRDVVYKRNNIYQLPVGRAGVLVSFSGSISAIGRHRTSTSRSTNIHHY